MFNSHFLPLILRVLGNFHIGKTDIKKGRILHTGEKQTNNTSKSLEERTKEVK